MFFHYSFIQLRCSLANCVLFCLSFSNSGALWGLLTRISFTQAFCKCHSALGKLQDISAIPGAAHRLGLCHSSASPSPSSASLYFCSKALEIILAEQPVRFSRILCSFSTLQIFCAAGSPCLPSIVTGLHYLTLFSRQFLQCYFIYPYITLIVIIIFIV